MRKPYTFKPRRTNLVSTVARCDAELLLSVCAALIEKLQERLEPTLGKMNIRSGTTPTSLTSASDFVDPEFVAMFGPGLSRVANATLVNQALVLLLPQVQKRPRGRRG